MLDQVELFFSRQFSNIIGYSNTQQSSHYWPNVINNYGHIRTGNILTGQCDESINRWEFPGHMNLNTSFITLICAKVSCILEKQLLHQSKIGYAQAGGGIFLRLGNVLICISRISLAVERYKRHQYVSETTTASANLNTISDMLQPYVQSSTICLQPSAKDLKTPMPRPVKLFYGWAILWLQMVGQYFIQYTAKQICKLAKSLLGNWVSENISWKGSSKNSCKRYRFTLKKIYVK